MHVFCNKLEFQLKLKINLFFIYSSIFLIVSDNILAVDGWDTGTSEGKS